MEGDFFQDSDVPNDIIDIYGKPDVNLKMLKPTCEEELRLEFEGNSVDCVLVNTIRRTVMEDIPVFGFNRSNVTVDVDRSKHIYNNDFIYKQMETLPIFDINNHYDLEDPKNYLPTVIQKNIFGNFKGESISEEEENGKKKKLLNIELNISVKNNDRDHLWVTTHECVLKIDGKESDSYKKHEPIAIFSLKRGEEIYINAIANLSIAKIHATYEATTVAAHIEHAPNKYEFFYETLGQLDKGIIFMKACLILIKKLENLHKYLKEKYEDEDIIFDTVGIELHNEGHTIGNLLANILQKCKYTSKAGYCMRHEFVKKVTLLFVTDPKSKKKPITILLDCIKYQISVFSEIMKKFSQIPFNKY